MHLNPLKCFNTCLFEGEGSAFVFIYCLVLTPLSFFIWCLCVCVGGGGLGVQLICCCGCFCLFVCLLFFVVVVGCFFFFWGGGGRRMPLFCYDVLSVRYRFEITLNPKFGVWMHLVFVECRVPFERYCDLD